MNVKALIVDDEEQCVRSLEETVLWETLGISGVFGAFSAREARQIVLREQISLILCDVEMPGESGLEFIQWVREQSDLGGANMECIILTCYPEYNYMRRSMQMGCGDYLIKPIDERELSEVLRKAVGRIQAREEVLQRESDRLTELLSETEEKDNLIKSKVIPYIQAHYTEKLTVAGIADDAGLNAQYMMRLFRKTTGRSILEYVTALRLSMAAELLKKTDWTNEIISGKVGYDTSNYFIRQFKKEYGITPREYRKRHSASEAGLHDTDNAQGLV